MRAFLISAVALTSVAWAVAIFGGTGSTIDFSTASGFQNTCAKSFDAKSLTSNQQRQTFAICRDIKLVQNIASFAKKYQSSGAGHLTDAEARKVVRDQLTHIRDELRSSRVVLEAITLGPGEGLSLKPSTWQLDLDGDGRTKTWEKYFFSIPKREDGPVRFGTPSDREQFYQDEYNLDAIIQVDRSDIAWALSYHYFIESLVETVLAYTLNRKEIDEKFIELADPTGMQRAHQLMLSGLKMSDRTRELVEAEKDDLHEWIGNERQRNSVFPILLDKGDFQAWGELLKHVIPLVAGETLLSANQGIGGLLGQIAKACPSGMALNVAKFYQNPPRYPAQMFFNPDWSFMCQEIDAAHPASGLAEFLADYDRRASSEHGAGMKFLRRLLWVN